MTPYFFGKRQVGPGERFRPKLGEKSGSDAWTHLGLTRHFLGFGPIFKVRTLSGWIPDVRQFERKIFGRFCPLIYDRKFSKFDKISNLRTLAHLHFGADIRTLIDFQFST